MRFMRSAGLCSALAMVVLPPATAQDRGATHDHASPAASPYAGMESRAVKALSDQQIADLAAGRGMGLALAAELNGYPGPAHTLELADALMLSDNQRARTKALFDAMKAETIPIGQRLIAEETALDLLFHDKAITRASLDAATARIGAAQGELRAAHLRYHLAMMDILSPPQIARYQELRGYAGHGVQGGMHHHAE
ncbi:MAG TPA: periplasmic heavy metal sensor [Stellaceae bacterium]|nr:periplasmic heavy metal sensor [Stellaceae bacterium]